MSVVNFTITQALEKKVGQMVKELGFSSRAEFFRFLAINFIANQRSSEEISYERSIQELSSLIQKKAKKKPFRSLESQMADLLE